MFFFFFFLNYFSRFFSALVVCDSSVSYNCVFFILFFCVFVFYPHMSFNTVQLSSATVYYRKMFVAGLSVDWRDPVKWQLVVDTSGRGPVSSQVDPIDGRPGRSRLGAGRSLRLIRPTTSPSLSQVIYRN